ncbi:MAG: translation initiation factor IF-2 [Fimbriimonadaceae bacterium]|nr:translation initiation factor IF-2 [Fimbriimonadaceae bacterium]
MQTQVKKDGMQVTIAELAKAAGLKPGQVYGALSDLGVTHDGVVLEAEADEIELIKEAVNELPKDSPLVLQPNRTPRDIANALGVPQQEVQKTLMIKLKVMATLTTNLKPDDAERLAKEFGCEIVWGDGPKPKPAAKPAAAAKKSGGLQHRPPVVTIMGHVDHGKTSLLDYIRKAKVADKEHGGITQHIGAYQVELPEGKITFLDTPGHAAFTAMRARGAQVTDIAILVVAADDGIMPQTIEAINHIKNSGVPMIVAVNKIDRPEANPDRVTMQLTEHEVVPEAFGGQIPVCPVSAITGQGVPELLEIILLQAGVMNLQADPKGDLEAVVVEAKLEKGRGPVATLLVQNGTLKIGDNVVVGNTHGRMKAMTDYMGNRIQEAGPSVPVEILGLNDVPAAGDHILVCDDERKAREIAEERADAAHVKSLQAPSRGLTLQNLKSRLTEGEGKDLNLIVKADVQGSVEAVKGLIEQIENDEVSVKVIHSAVGGITESDVLLASAASAIVVGFNVKPEGNATHEAERKGVEIRTYRIIYELIEDIEKAVKGMLEPKFEEQHLGTVEVRVRFQFGRKGIIAGCFVTEGKVVRNALCRVTRNREEVFAGKIGSLKHFKEDVREMTMGQECGITFDDWEAFKEGDVVEVYEMVQVND